MLLSYTMLLSFNVLSFQAPVEEKAVMQQGLSHAAFHGATFNLFAPLVAAVRGSLYICGFPTHFEVLAQAMLECCPDRPEPAELHAYM